VLPEASCHFYYTYMPTSNGSYSATSTFSLNAGTFSIKLQGTTMNGLFLPLVIR